MRTTVKVGAQHKITVPKVIREELEIEEGDVVEIEIID